MGWADGPILADNVWEEVRKYIPLSDREEVAKAIYVLFCNEDADGWDGDFQLEKDAKVDILNDEDYDDLDDDETI